MAKRKSNFMKTYKKRYKKGERTTTFNIPISSKALFGLSPTALKLYIFMILNGKKNTPSIGRFASMMKVSPRTISRYYEELKEKEFLKITPIGINKYKYEFDMNGNVNVEWKPIEKKIEEPIIIEEYLVPEILVVEDNQEVVDYTEIISEAKSILEYEDFAVLENIYWTLPYKVQEQIKNILKERRTIDSRVKDPIDWFLNKIE